MRTLVEATNSCAFQVMLFFPYLLKGIHYVPLTDKLTYRCSWFKFSLSFCLSYPVVLWKLLFSGKYIYVEHKLENNYPLNFLQTRYMYTQCYGHNHKNIPPSLTQDTNACNSVP